MLLKPEPIFEAVEELKRDGTRVVLLSPAGRKFSQATAHELARVEHLLLVTGHYEGFDERVREALADDELSIGDYVLTNGALPAMVVVDAVTRLLPGALGDERSPVDESFSNGLLNIRNIRDRRVRDEVRRFSVRQHAGCQVARSKRSRDERARPVLLWRRFCRADPIESASQSKQKILNQALLDKIERNNIARTKPASSYDSVRVHTKVVEGDKERIRFRRRGDGAARTA
jgi:hypothetical protein